MGAERPHHQLSDQFDRDADSDQVSLALTLAAGLIGTLDLLAHSSAVPNVLDPWAALRCGRVLNVLTAPSRWPGCLYQCQLF